MLLHLVFPHTHYKPSFLVLVLRESLEIQFLAIF